MVEKFKEILSMIQQQKGNVSFFGLFKMDEVVDKWTVLLSAPWTSESTRKEDFEFIRNLLIQNLSSEEISSVARLGIISKEAHLIQILLKYQPNTEINKDTSLNGNIIHEGYILASNPLG